MTPAIKRGYAKTASTTKRARLIKSVAFCNCNVVVKSINMDQKTQASNVIKLLKTQYINPKTELNNWSNPIQFMVCVILSAQATDKGVNKVTEALFNKYKSATDFANADRDQLKTYIKSINFYNSKAERIISSNQYIMQNYDGKIPQDIEQLVKIPGVGRKSANVILGEIFNITAGIVVDTHIKRFSNRIGLTKNTDPQKIELDLMTLIDKSDWRYYGAAGVLHGRYICKARKPLCTKCVLAKICPASDLTN